MNRGFTLLEVTIAIFILLVGATAASVLIAKTVGQIGVSSSKLIASYLTKEGIEIVRNIRDTNWLEGGDWDEGLTGCSDGCEADYTATTAEDPEDEVPPLINPYGDGRSLYIDDSDGFYKYIDFPDPDDIETKYKRKITIVLEDVDPPDGVDELKVTVETTWSEKGKNYSHTAQEILYNWK